MGLTKHGITTGLERLGLGPPCHLMVHASLSRFGHVEGGAQTVVAALRQVAGEAGAVIVPSFRDAIRSEHYALRECRPVCPARLCPSRERGYTGIVGETIREQPDALRSCHPTHSWVGVGGDAAFLLDGHGQSPTPCGKGSPFFRLLERDGHVLLLGVGVNSLTNIHAVEDVRNVPYLSAVDPPNRHATYTTSGKRVQYLFPHLLHDTLDRCGLIRQTVIGEATCMAIAARPLAAFLWKVVEDDPWCLVVRPTTELDPESDARRKTARMVEAWRAHPDVTLWRKMLEVSEQAVTPVAFEPAEQPATDCPAYAGLKRGYHRCAANDLPPWERFEDYPADEPGVATCRQCNWPRITRELSRDG